MGYIPLNPKHMEAPGTLSAVFFGPMPVWKATKLHAGLRAGRYQIPCPLNP